MEIGIDSFASAMYGSNELSSVDAMEQLLNRIEAADQAAWTFLALANTIKKSF